MPTYQLGARSDQDRGTLAPGAYLSYFAQLARAFTLMRQRYLVLPQQPDTDEGGQPEAKFEAEAVTDLLDRLLHSLGAIYYRAIYSADESVLIDLTDSGFPNGHELRRMAADQTRAEERLGVLPSRKVLARRLVDQLIKDGEEPIDTLAQLGERTYFERLRSDDKLFLLSTPGSLVRTGNGGERRKYAYSWGVYDTMMNRPYIYLLSFDQDLAQTPLEEPGPFRDRFLQVVTGTGSGSSSLYQFMLEIDQALEGIYPKIVKRIGLGPFYSERVFAACQQDTLTPQEQAVRDLLRTTGNSEDFILTGTDEVVFSQREERIAKTILQNLGLRKSIQQIFYIPNTGVRNFASDVSKVHRYAVLPHAALQNLPESRESFPPELGAGATMLPYGEKGLLYV